MEREREGEGGMEGEGGIEGDGRERLVMREGREREGGGLDSLGKLWQPGEDIWSLSLLTCLLPPDYISDGLIFRWAGTPPLYNIGPKQPI